ncbi:hypothetical protein GQ54DRAFT_185216 [Martensiomyces pterosporus]|nr:hypothetical protein GQ54DRAFT_185216 [Martensiomyces pterosporus]
MCVLEGQSTREFCQIGGGHGVSESRRHSLAQLESHTGLHLLDQRGVLYKMKKNDVWDSAEKRRERKAPLSEQGGQQHRRGKADKPSGCGRTSPSAKMQQGPAPIFFLPSPKRRFRRWPITLLQITLLRGDARAALYPRRCDGTALRVPIGAGELQCQSVPPATAVAVAVAAAGAGDHPAVCGSAAAF